VGEAESRGGRGGRDWIELSEPTAVQAQYTPRGHLWTLHSWSKPVEGNHIPAEHWAMSDSEGDSYHEEGFPSLQCDQDDNGSLDSLPDLVLSAATTLSQTTQELLDQLDLTGSLDVRADFDSDYSVAGEQVTVTADGLQARYIDEGKLDLPAITASARYRSYLNIAQYEEADSDEDSVTNKFTSLGLDKQLEQRRLWAEELAIVDGQIQGLEMELRQQARRALLLKRKLGLTAWREFSEDMKEGINRLQERLQSSEAISRMSNTLVEWERGWQGIRAKASEELARAQKAAEEGMRKASLSLQEKGILEPSQEYRGQGSSTENTGTKESKA